MSLPVRCLMLAHEVLTVRGVLGMSADHGSA